MADFKYKKLSNQPLVYVLAEFRFSKILKIVDYIPELQEALRKDYPELAEKRESSLSFKNNELTVGEVTSWSFISADAKDAVIINQERIIYLTTKYDRYDGFSKSCKKVVKALVDIVKPNLVHRIGLRYGDVIQLDGLDCDASNLVSSHFCPPDFVDQIGEVGAQVSESRIVTDQGLVLVRSWFGFGKKWHLDDLQSMPISIGNKEDDESKRIILDFDHFWDAKGKSVEFNTKTSMQTLDSLHETSRKAFWICSTDFARNKVWA